MLTLCIGFEERRFQKNYCQMYHTILSDIVNPILQNGGHFQSRGLIRVSQNLRGAEPPMLTICIGFVGRRFQKKVLPNTSCHYIRHFPQKWRPFFKVIRVIFENMRQIFVTLVSTYIIFLEYYSDSILLRASHNGGLNLAGCCGNLF